MRPRTKAARKNTGVASARRGLDMGGNDDDSDDEDDDEETTEAELSAMNGHRRETRLPRALTCEPWLLTDQCEWHQCTTQ